MQEREEGEEGERREGGITVAGCSGGSELALEPGCVGSDLEFFTVTLGKLILASVK